MGEANEAKKTALAQASEDVMVAQTMGGRMHVRWDETAQATPHGQLVCFAEFLATAGVFERWVEGCLLSYSSPNASSKRDVLGTLMLGILAGSRRYAHIAGVRGDAVAAQALGLRSLVSEDSVRRALKAMLPEASEPWMRTALMDSVRSALGAPAWVTARSRAAPIGQPAEKLDALAAALPQPMPEDRSSPFPWRRDVDRQRPALRELRRVFGRGVEPT